MSGFFSLSSSNKDHQDQQDHTNNLSLSKNQEFYYKGFELWQQYYHLHQQRHTAQDVPDFSVGPSRRHTGGDEQCSSYSSYRSGGARVMRQAGRSSGGDGVNCQDCGNQAKKDCPHVRCRTCCKSRGFHCATHVKSTWVPAAKRRERQQQQQALTVGRGEAAKRPRENPGGTSAIACSSSRLPAAGTGFETGHFPSQLSSPAVFRCVRVSAVDDADEHLAYQTAVNIGGHVFKGILYDQGADGAAQHHQPLDLIAGAAESENNQNVAMIDPSSMYTAPLSAFMAGTQFFPPPRQ